MSITYPDLENKFPDEIDNFDRFLDPTLEFLDVINQYYALYDAGDIAGATAILNSNPMLKRMILNADNVNKLRDMCISTQRYFKDRVQEDIMSIIKTPVIYSASTKYKIYDIVRYIVGGADLYFWCFNRNTPIGASPTNTNYFIPISIRGEKGESGTGLSYRGGWNSTTQYYKDDCIADNNKLWSANANNINSKPVVDNADWTLIIDIYRQSILSSTQPSNQATGDVWYQII